jgi:hypothetical protein
LGVDAGVAGAGTDAGDGASDASCRSRHYHSGDARLFCVRAGTLRRLARRRPVPEKLKPLREFLVLGLLYSLTLILIHQLLWNNGTELGHQLPQAAIDFGARFDLPLRELAVRGYTVMISLLIGVGSGVAIGLFASLARVVRGRLERSAAGRGGGR